MLKISKYSHTEDETGALQFSYQGEGKKTLKESMALTMDFSMIRYLLTTVIATGCFFVLHQAGS